VYFQAKIRYRRRGKLKNNQKKRQAAQDLYRMVVYSKVSFEKTRERMAGTNGKGAIKRPNIIRSGEKGFRIW